MEKQNTANQTKYLADYKASDFSINSVKLDFALFDNQTIVTAKLDISKVNKTVNNLELNGENLQLLSVDIDGESFENYEVLDNKLIIKNTPDSFILSTQVIIHPEKNTLLEGLYKSSNIFCTQCEAEGFRRITYFLDRPDVMTKYSVRIEADENKYPKLLSNGNLVNKGSLGNGRHYANWDDPHLKPSYLFALVAGNLASVEKTIQTKSGNDVVLEVLTEPDFISQADYALGALERALRWDEQTFNLEYDLDKYMVVAIGDFNMGAMENKGLNVFNSKYVLATPKTATDKDFLNIENIIGHEYFHNWTGNRVTCRDWFQLSLKEGLTVFRDALFSADMTTKGIKRLEEVKTVREHQFIEDQGPMSHPVRPDNYIEINNFYTLTVYEKGSEVIRMIYNLIGEENFKKGIELYFKRHDGTAVTVEDFAQAMTDASGFDFMGQFFKWYTQSGTPKLSVETNYDKNSKIFKIQLNQTHKVTANQLEKHNLVIPVTYKLFDKNGKSISKEEVLIVDESTKTIEIKDITQKPVLSILRNFSAPVIVEFEQSDKDLHTLVRYDDDLFIRFNAMQILLKRCVRLALNNDEKVNKLVDEKVNEIVDTYKYILNSPDDLSEKSEILSLPSLSVFFETMDLVDVTKLAKIVNQIKQKIAISLTDNLIKVIDKKAKYNDLDLSFLAISERKYKNTCLAILAKTKLENVKNIAKQIYNNSNTMTNKLSALAVLNTYKSDDRKNALLSFYNEFKTDPQVMDKWFAIQASANFDSTFDEINKLAEHKLFSLTNPNKVRSLFGTFCMGNLEQFHNKSGKGYKLLANLVAKLDKINPSIAARMVTPLTQWKRFDNNSQKLMKSELQQLLENTEISKDLYEVVSKSVV